MRVPFSRFVIPQLIFLLLMPLFFLPLSVGDVQAADTKSSIAKLPGVMLQGLDRTTARTSTFSAFRGVSVFFGRLEIIMRQCKKSDPTEPPENTAFLEIYEYPLTRRATIAQAMKEARAKEIAEGVSEEEQIIHELERLKIVVEEYGAEILEEEFEPDLIFSGWMFSSSPPLNALEHPVYDVWVLSCTSS